MKHLILALIAVMPVSSYAVTWKVVGPCSETPWYQGTYQADLKKSVGDNTIAIFDTNKIPYMGVAEGINSVNKSAVGLDAMEVISDTEMRAYGWCVAVNGKIPEVMPNKVALTSQQDEIVWFYGYSTNKNNQWLDMCQPGYKIKAEQFCKK